MASIEVKCTYCSLHNIDRTITRAPGQIEHNKSKVFFCNIDEMNAYRNETGGITKGKHIVHGYRKAMEAEVKV
jgi:hypothetical protein